MWLETVARLFLQRGENWRPGMATASTKYTLNGAGESEIWGAGVHDA
jgi:hypothetical protein